MNPRLAAAKALAAVLNGKASLNSSLPTQLDKVEDRDRGFTQDLAFGTARWQPRLSALAATLDSQVQVIEVGGLLRELIVALVEQGDQGDQAYYEAVVGLALLELQRARRSPIRIALPVGADRRLTSACQAVMASPSLDIPFEQHAEAAGASVRTLARLFQNSLGMGFAEWRRQVQLATAVAELIQGQPVSAIARSLGYSPSSFSDMFRRELGMAPSQYPV